MAFSFEDTQVINRSDWFSGNVPGPQLSLTDAQQAKLDQLNALIVEVGDIDFDTEIDLLIQKMTEIRDAG